MSAYDQLLEQLREVIQRRADRNQPITWRTRVTRGLRAWPVVAAVCVSIGMMLVAVTALRAQHRGQGAAGTRPGRPIVIGASSEPITAPQCPAATPPPDCTIVLTQVTALPSVSGGVHDPTTVIARGYVTAFTIGVSQLSHSASSRASDVRYLDKVHGGTPQVVITVLAPVGAVRPQQWVVTAQSSRFRLQSDLGKVVSFNLVRPLHVAAGDAIALTVPTWAPVLSIGPGYDGYAYRQSRSTDCESTSAAAAAQLKIGERASYRCSYGDARVEFSVTEHPG